MSSTITATEIKQIRETYGLSQRSFAQLLGIGPASMVRYEQGAKPTRANANLIRAARNPQFMAECLEEDGGNIPKKQLQRCQEAIRAQHIIYDYISLDPEEDALLHEGLDVSGLPPTTSMNEAYHYTLQQEILNEQAANLIGEIISFRVASGAKNSEEGEFVSLLKQLSLMKPTIVSRETQSDTKLAEIRGFLQNAAAMLARRITEVA